MDFFYACIQICIYLYTPNDHDICQKDQCLCLSKTALGLLVAWFAYLACFLACFFWLLCFALLAWFAWLAWVTWLTCCLACFTWLGWFARLAQNFSSPRTTVILKFCQTQAHEIFNLQGNPCIKWSWAWFFWRPLQEGNFKIFLTTFQLHRIPNPIWFCNCKLKCTVWKIWGS